MDRQRQKILIVEDNTEDRESFRRALCADDGDCDWDFIEAGTGEEGLLLCIRDMPDCVILDYRLPDIDALAFLASLCRGKSEPPMPVVVVSGEGSEAIAVSALRAGAHNYLVKGAPETDIRRAVEASIAERKPRMEMTYRVLIIEDSAEDREAHRRRLMRGTHAFVFAEAETGEEGLALFRTFKPDCVLLDFRLPDMDGLEVLSDLTKNAGSHRSAIIMLAGKGNEAVAVRALKEGADDYLVKGAALEGLLQSVRSAVDKTLLRRRLEEEQREVERNRNELRVTLSSIADAVISTDTKTHITFLNHVAEELTGWGSSDASGLPLREVFVLAEEESGEPVSSPAIQATQGGDIAPRIHQALLIRKDGSFRPIEISIAPIRDEAGNVLGSVLVFRDVTERRRAQQSLTLQSRVLESMVEGVSVSNEEGEIFYTNAAEDAMFGCERGELLGQNLKIFNLYPAAENEPFSKEVMDCLVRNGSWAGERCNRRKDGSDYANYARITTLDVAGKNCFVCVKEDITARKELEQELKQRVEELAVADKRKDQFLAMLAHELRNPLAPIRNSLHVLKLKCDEPHTVNQMREMMGRQVGHLARLVDDLLDVSCITQNKVKLITEAINLAQLVRECASDCVSQFEAANINLTVAVPETPVWIFGDPTRLTQVLENFLTNTIKFTNRDGEVSVKVYIGDGEAKLSVSDNGIGIPPAVLPHIFEVFTQADRTLDRCRGGLGLGLAIVQGLVHLHGGTVAAKSYGFDQGTEMIVSLPLYHGVPSSVYESTEITSRPSGRRILVVEDNLDAAESLRLLLELSGYQVTVAHTGTEGARMALESELDVVVCDIGLPEMDGYAVARYLRQHASTLDLRLIAMTGYGQEEDLKNAREAGFDDHLVKPVDPEKLLQKLNCIGRSH